MKIVYYIVGKDLLYEINEKSLYKTFYLHVGSFI